MRLLRLVSTLVPQMACDFCPWSPKKLATCKPFGPPKGLRLLPLVSLLLPKGFANFATSKPLGPPKGLRLVSPLVPQRACDYCDFLAPWFPKGRTTCNPLVPLKGLRIVQALWSTKGLVTCEPPGSPKRVIHVSPLVPQRAYDFIDL